MYHSTKIILLAFTLTLTSAVLTPVTTFAADDKKPSDKKTPIVKPYPLDVCIVTDNELGSMGDEQRMIYEGKEIKFCCTPCFKKFHLNPAKYLQKILPPPENKKL